MNKKLIVLQIISSPIGGGAEFLVRELGSKLCEHGIRSEVIYFSEENIELHSNELSLGINPRDCRAIFKLRKIFRSKLIFNKLIVHVHLTWPFFYVVFAAIGLDIKLIFTEHNTFNHRRKIPFFKYIERFFYRYYSDIVCISQGVKQSLKKQLGEKLYPCTQVICNGSRLYDFKKRAAPLHTLHFISVGSIVKRKNFQTSLRALSLLKEMNWTYTIVGEGPEKKQLSFLAIELGVHDKIYFTGWVNNVEKYLYQADIQLIPSLWEGFGLVAVEGMSTGLPVVASNVDGLREVLNKENPAVFLVNEVENPNCWLHNIMQCVTALKKSSCILAEASRNQSELFSIDKMIYCYADLYKKKSGIIDENEKAITSGAFY